MSTRVVLAYNGDFAATVAIRWLIETQGAEVVTVTLDLGQRRDPAEARERALAAGAVRAHVLDVRDQFARDHILPALRAESFDHRDHADVVTLAWPLIARKLVELAVVERAAAVAHGSQDAGIERFVRELDPDLMVLAPARAWHMTPAELAEWARLHQVPVFALPEHACKIDENLWGRAVTWIGGAGDQSVPDDIRRVSKSRPTPDAAAFVEITFERETPVAVNGVPMALAELIESVSVIAGEQGVGRVERSTVNEGGTVTRVIVDAPAPVVLHAAFVNRDSATNTVRLKLSGGQQTVISEMVNHA